MVTPMSQIHPARRPKHPAIDTSAPYIKPLKCTNCGFTTYDRSFMKKACLCKKFGTVKEQK